MEMIKGLDYKIYTDKEGKERVKFDCGEDVAVLNGKDGKYFCVPNIFTNNKSFKERIKDAIEIINQGYADAMLSASFGLTIFNTMLVVKFLDRKFGEEIRKKTLANFKNKKFGYSIKFKVCKAMKDYLIMKDGNLQTIFDGPNYLFFDDKKEAENYIKEITKQVNILLEEYDTCPKENKSEWLKDKFPDNALSSVKWEMFTASISNDNYTLSVVQVTDNSYMDKINQTIKKVKNNKIKPIFLFEDEDESSKKNFSQYEFVGMINNANVYKVTKDELIIIEGKITKTDTEFIFTKKYFAVMMPTMQESR